MPSDLEQMQAFGAGGAAGSFVLPKIPEVPIPPRIAKAYPELVNWQKQTIEAWEKWRQDATATINGRSA